MGEWSHLYDRAWKKRRAQQLEEHPLCKLCMDLREMVTVATVADHIVPHRGDPELFAGPLQSLCSSCHSTWKQAQESGGRMRGCDVNGYPLDPAHPWNRGGEGSR